MMSVVSAGLMCVAVLWWSAPQISTGQLINIDLSQGTNNTQPIYCSATVSGFNACMPSACYWSGSRSQCCMFKNTSANGATFYQCLCNTNVNCSVTPAPTTPPTAPFLYDFPNYCPETTYSETYPKPCRYHDACFNSTTRDKCCSRTFWKWRQLTDGTITNTNLDGITKCYCTADVPCAQF